MTAIRYSNFRVEAARLGDVASRLLDFEVEDIRNLEVYPIEQNQVAADHHVRVIRRRGWEHPFQIRRARLDSSLKPRRQSSANH